MEKSKFDNFKHYEKAQIETHVKKIQLLWFCGLTALPLKEASERLLSKKNNSIICMGSRNGLEPRFFRESGFSRAVGTDIGPTANIFPFMMQHDFHEFQCSF